MVLTDLARKARDGSELPAQGVILTDNSYVCGFLVDRRLERDRPNAPLVQALLALLRDSPIGLHWTIVWISAVTSAYLGTMLPMARPHAEREPAAPGVDLQTWTIALRTTITLNFSASNGHCRTFSRSGHCSMIREATYVMRKFVPTSRIGSAASGPVPIARAEVSTWGAHLRTTHPSAQPFSLLQLIFNTIIY